MSNCEEADAHPRNALHVWGGNQQDRRGGAGQNHRGTAQVLAAKERRLQVFDPTNYEAPGTSDTYAFVPTYPVLGRHPLV